MIVVSDTSVIINLAAIGQIDLLYKLFQHVVIPQAVFDEIVRYGDELPGSLEVRSALWMEVRHITDKDILGKISDYQLDAGETEAIALALELNTELILMDEFLGRTLAVEMKLRPIGILGVLLEAKRSGLIASIKPLMDDLLNKARFFIHQSLYERVLKLAQE
ncbi:MAG: DUF3368 domain-containing protein [Spirosomaceae bacterium]|jgi:uncharacterized protein|nr:DUF3368 domain-containing protein [Spirosomataceae bacterium]